MTTLEIEAYIRRHAPEEARRRRMYEYYRGRHAICGRKMQDPSKPNNQLVNGYPGMIANAFSGYLFGEPVSYGSENPSLIENLTQCFRYNDEQAENSTLALDCAVCGIAVEILYIDADAEIRFRRVEPVCCIPVYDSTIEENLTALIRYYDVTDVVQNTTTRYVEVYDAEKKSVYNGTSGGTLQLISEEEHSFGDVPAIVYKNNADGIGDFEGVISLIDAYDLMQSESLNEQEYFSDAYLVLKGLDGSTAEDIAAMKERRVLLIPTDSGAEWLVKQQSDSIPENIKERLNNDIHRFSGCPDMTDESFAGNASGVALKYKLLQFENIAGGKEREFKRGLQRRIELLCVIWQVLGRGGFDWRDVAITFKRALPQNLLEISQTISNLGGILSGETRRGLLPMDIDEEAEKRRLEEESRAGMSLFGAIDE